MDNFRQPINMLLGEHQIFTTKKIHPTVCIYIYISHDGSMVLVYMLTWLGFLLMGSMEHHINSSTQKGSVMGTGTSFSKFSKIPFWLQGFTFVSPVFLLRFQCTTKAAWHLRTVPRAAPRSRCGTSSATVLSPWRLPMHWPPPIGCGILAMKVKKKTLGCWVLTGVVTCY